MSSQGSGARGNNDNAGVDRLKLEIRRSAKGATLLILLVVGGIVAAGVLFRNLSGNKPWVKYATYKFAFTDVKGVQPQRAELRLAGVKAGTIKSSSYKNGQAILTVNLEKKYAPVYKDAKVRIRPVTPLEDMYVDIESRGHPNAGKLTSKEILPTEHTLSPVEVGNVLQTFDEGTQKNLATMIDELGSGLHDHGRDLKWAFVQLSPFFKAAHQMSTALDDRRQNLARLIHNFGGITQELSEHDKALAGFVKQGDSTLNQLAKDDRPLQGTLAELPGTLATMRSSFANLEQTENVLDPALHSLRPVAKSLPTGLDNLTRFSKQAKPALDAVRPAARSLKPLARVVQPTSRSLSAAFTPLQREAPQFDWATKKITPCEPAIQKFITNTMSMTKFDMPDEQGNPFYVANARADARYGVTTAGGYIKDPAWSLAKPCEDANMIGKEAPR